MHRRPIGKDDTKVSPVWVLYRDWLYRKFFLGGGGGAKWDEEDVGGIEGL